MPHRRLINFLSLLFLVVLAAPAWSQSEDAQKEKEKEPLAGHSYHGEVFNEGPRQQAYLMGGTGNVHLQVTTKNPEAQKFFDQGVGQLHGFWYFEAERSFRQVAKLDPECAMAYWGMAMANTSNNKRAKGFMKKAMELKNKASKREQMWIDGLADYVNADSKQRKQARRKYMQSLENIIHTYPDELEAKAFLAVSIWQFEGDWPLGSRQAVDSLIQQVFDANPMHPAHHYRIHLWDREKAERAVASAARCGQSAPTIAHMWHMPGHIFSRLQRYGDAVWQQEASSRADHAHMIRDRVLPDQIHNYAHNQEWLIRNLNYLGQMDHGLDLAKNLVELPRHPKYNTLSRRGNSASYGRLRLFQVLELYELWDEIVAMKDSMYMEPTDQEDQQLARLRLIGLAYAGKRDTANLDAQISLLQKQVDEIVTKAEKEAKEKKTRAAKGKKDEKGNKKDTKKGDGKAAQKANPKTKNIESVIHELTGYRLLLEGKNDEAKKVFKKVSNLSRIAKSRIALQTGDLEEAEKLAEQDANSSNNQVVPLANFIHILHERGKEKEVAANFEKLRKMSGHIERLSVPVFQRLQPVAKALKLPEDWRLPVELAKDIGNRPDFAEIGPFRWRPSPAADWKLPNASGETVRLADYRGKPVIVIFYLGYGCLHCVEQINKFGPLTKRFADEGISLVAISTDNVKDLKNAKINYNKEGTFPFPLLSDAKMDIFKAYRTFDDFESQPLHGTFLIDANGLVRWQDISYEPFMNSDFLLEESRRLLQLPATSLTSTTTEAKQE